MDGEVQDAIKAVDGGHWLDGQLPATDNASSRPFRVKIIVKGAELFGEEYSMLLDGEEHKLGQGWIP